MQVNPFSVDTIDQNQLWVHYDDEADSIVFYLTGQPMFAVSVEVEPDTYLKIDPATRNIVGFHVEGWEQKFLPAHADLRAVWQSTKRGSQSDSAWNQFLRMVALWMIFLLKSERTFTRSAVNPLS
ncbi:MAG: DUF2283 domain-containing protein [Caldilineaceae bacterium]|nr:DUF2283 domain-containing protein [Caldilineaceae bacterium]